MIELTEQQHQSIAGKDNPTVIDPSTKTTYVLIRSDVFERIKGLLVDADWTPAEELRLLAESGHRAGWNDPAMDVYDNYDENRKKQCP